MLDIDFESRHRIINKNKKVVMCLQCGTCTSSCLIPRYLKDYNPRMSFIHALYGSRKAIENPTLWACSVCHTCQDRCPEGVNPTDLLISLKELAFAEGLAPKTVAQGAELVLSTGRAYPTSAIVDSAREKLELGKLRGIDVKDLNKIAEKTGLRKKLDKLKG